MQEDSQPRFVRLCSGAFVLGITLLSVDSNGLAQSGTEKLGANSYEVVMRLSDEFEKSGEDKPLMALTNLIPKNMYGPNAAGALNLLVRKVTRKQAQSIIVPAFVAGLNSTNADIRRSVAIGLSEYSACVAPDLPALIKFLGAYRQEDMFDTDTRVIDAIGSVGKDASAAIPTLLKIIDWKPTDISTFEDLSCRVAAVKAIGRIGFSDSVTRSRLEKAFSDANVYVRFRAATALIDNKFISEAALATLSQTMTNGHIGFTLGSDTLQSIRAAVKNANPAVQKSARDFLTKFGATKGEPQ